MNRKEAKELLPVIEAYAEGKAIQYRAIDGGYWYDIEEDKDVEWDRYEYRVKPESKQWFSAKVCLPAINVECIVLDEQGRVSFAHMVNPLKAESYEGWNIPGVAWWMPFKPTKDMKEYYGQ